MRHTLPGLLIVLLTACSGAQTERGNVTTPQDAAPLIVEDIHSFARPAEARVTHVALDLTADFASRTLQGSATLTVKRAAGATEIVLDTRDLEIQRVTDASGAELKFVVGAAQPILGRPLTVTLPSQGDSIVVHYKTSPASAALQWLSPSQTAGRKLPYLYSQGQAILTRTWIPTQDSPGIRQTYQARILAPPDLRVVMSAEHLTPDGVPAGNGKAYEFRLTNPVPPYLIAIAIGDLASRPIGPRTAVFTEPSVLDRAASEFADLETMVQKSEPLLGQYRWGRYDLLVLPPSFPFGGMENPRLTFATPTILAGDRSLVSLVAHELAHSWSGNLVTAATWRDIWLNEGFTTYVQGRITEALYGKELADMERQIDQQELLREFAAKEIQPADQVLALPPLDGRDADDALSDVAYTKGAWFLQFLEQRVGRAVFDPFLRGWFDDHAFQSVTTPQFVDYLRSHLLAKHPQAVSDAELDAWLNQPGIPPFAERARSRGFATVDSARIAWLGSGQLPPAALTGKWSTQEWVHFLEGLPAVLQPAQLAALDAAYHFSGTPNGEIARSWYPLAVRGGYHAGDAQMAAFLQRVGRRKLIIPTYEALVKTPEGLAFAKEVFAKARPGYHPITTATVSALIAKAEQHEAPAPPAQ